MKNMFRGIGFCLVLAAPLFGAGTIAVTPQNESVGTGTSRQITAAGYANAAVSWSVNGMTPGNSTYGTIDANGIYTAPMLVPSPAAVTIQATSIANPTVYGTTNLTVKAPGAVLTSLNPASVAAGTLSIKLNGSGFVNGAVAYFNGKAATTALNSATQLTASITLSQGSYPVVVLMPNTMPSNSIYLSVTPASGGGNTYNQVIVSPTSASVVQGLTQQFTATLNGSPANVTWSATAGTVSASGLYTAPAAIPNPNAVTVTATYGNLSGSSNVTILSNIPPTVTGISQSPIPIGVFSMSLTGTGFTPSSVASLGNTAMATTFVSANQLSVTGYASAAGANTVTAANASIVSAPFAVQVGVANPQVSVSAARRFLEQAAFGPSPADASHVQQVGFQGWLNEQFAAPMVSNYQGLPNQNNMSPRFLTNAVTNPDQLRQRVGFAWSQLFVTSLNKIIWSTSMAPYQDMLLTDSFVNFRQLLGDVTLHPIMCQFLDMANNQKGNTAGTTLPNENYAREVLQLFSVGTSLLNPDGTAQVDNQNIPLPTYNQKTISEFARVFTGWSYTNSTPGQNSYFGAYVNPFGPMIAYPAYHDAGSKTLLNGQVIPAGLTPKQDLDAALDNIFNHPNMGPFISKFLILHLVKSNPSPAYVGRVAAVFANNGGGVRGDIKAVLTAILLDSEARQNDQGGQDQITDGHLQEPGLYLAGIFRALNGQLNDQNYLAGDMTSMGQDIFNAPSVFNYYSQFYRVPGFGIGGPEFQIFSPYTSVYRTDFVSGFFYNYQGNVQTQGPGASVDLTAYVNLAGTPSSLVDALDITFTRGTMPGGMKQTLTAAVTAESGGNLRRVQDALYLILTSGYYNVWH